MKLSNHVKSVIIYEGDSNRVALLDAKAKCGRIHKASLTSRQASLLLDRIAQAGVIDLQYWEDMPQEEYISCSQLVWGRLTFQ